MVIVLLSAMNKMVIKNETDTISIKIREPGVLGGKTESDISS